MAIATTPQIRLQNVGLAIGDELVVKTQAFNANLERGPFSPPSDLIRFIASPIWNPLQDQTLTEGDSVSVPLFAQIRTGASLKLSSPQLPSFARVDDFGNGSGRLLLEPQIGDAGLFEIRLDATNVGPPLLRTTETLYVHVSAFVVPPPTASPPLIAPIRDQSMRETQTVFIRASANTPALFSGLNLPSFVAIGNANGAATLIASPGYDDGGSYSIAIEAADLSDPSLVSVSSFELTVLELNRRPTLIAPSALSVTQGHLLSVPVSATDLDGDRLAFAAAIGGQLVASQPTSSLSSAVLEVPPSATQGGDFLLQVLVVDDGSPALDEQLTLPVSVVPNQSSGAIAPLLAALADASVVEGSAVDIDVQITNASAGAFSLDSSLLPGFASFSDLGNGRGRLTVAPAWGDRGFFDATLTATNDDDPGQTDSESVRVTVEQARVVASHDGRDEITILDPVTLQQVTINAGIYPVALASGPTGRVFALCGIDFGAAPGVFEIDLVNGRALPVSQDGLLAATSDGPRDLVVGDDGLIYVSVIDRDQSGYTPRIVSVDPDTGQQQLVHAGAPLALPLSIALGPDERLYLGDTLAGEVIAIDLATGASATVAPLANAHAMALHESGRLIVSSGANSAGAGSLWWLEPIAGDLQLLSDAHLLGDVSDIAVQPGGRLVVVDRDAPDLVLVDSQDGAQARWPLPGAGYTGVVVVPAP